MELQRCLRDQVRNFILPEESLFILGTDRKLSSTPFTNFTNYVEVTAWRPFLESILSIRTQIAREACISAIWGIADLAPCTLQPPTRERIHHVFQGRNRHRDLDA